MDDPKPRITEEHARRLLREYPDADLSGFEVIDHPDFDADVVAVEETGAVLRRLRERGGES